jgi:hypothetical protein
VLAAGLGGAGESGKVAGVVDAMDGGKSTAVPLDLVDAGGTEIQPVEGAKREVAQPAETVFDLPDGTQQQLVTLILDLSQV